MSLHNIGETHFLVVCQASTIEDWAREIRRRSSLGVTEIRGVNRMQTFKIWIHSGGVGITAYETTEVLETEEPFRMGLLVADDAHFIRHPKARKTIHVGELCGHADRLLFLTAMPMSYSVNGMISLIRMLDPETADRLVHLHYLSAVPYSAEQPPPCTGAGNGKMSFQNFRRGPKFWSGACRAGRK